MGINVSFVPIERVLRYKYIPDYGILLVGYIFRILHSDGFVMSALTRQALYTHVLYVRLR